MHLTTWSKKYFLTFCIAISLILFNSVFNQTKAQCPPNIDFEFGNFTNWDYGYGNTNANYPSQATPIPFGLRDTTPITPLKVEIINSTSSPSIDPYGGFPTLCPNGSGHSVRLGNDLIGAEEDALQYKFKVPTGASNYTITYQYAVVFQNPQGHLPAQQPRFQALVIDSATGQLISCASRDFVSDTSLPGFFISPSSYDASGVLDPNNIILYKGWTPSSINLKAMGGKTIYLLFIAFDCTLTGHFGYAYVDVNSQCGTNAIINSYCWNSTSATLSAPDGFQHYQWYDSTLTTSIDTLQFTTIPLPNKTKWYGVICTPYLGYGCTDTFYTKITPVLPPKPTANFSVPSPYCGGSIINFTDLSSSNISGVSIISWKWKFGDPNATGNAAPPNPDSSLLQNPQHYYSTIGNYTVRLIITTSAGCVDTLYKTIHITLPPPTVNITVSQDTLCAVKDTTTLMYTGTIPTGYAVQWSLNRGATLLSGNLNSAGPIVLSFDTVGMHYVGFTVVPPSTSPLVCWAHKNIPIYVKGFYPSISISGPDSVCISNLNTIELFSTPNGCSGTTSTCSNSTNFSLGTFAGIYGTFSSPFYCFSTYPKSRTQYLVTASELNNLGLNRGLIDGLAFYVVSKTSTSLTPFRNFNIKLACVSYNSIANGSGKLDSVSSQTLVYSNPSYTTNLGVNKFNFSTAYNWDGISNILVEVCFDNTGFTTSSGDQVYYSTLPLSNYYTVYALGTISETENACSRIFPQTANSFTNKSNSRPDMIFYGCKSSYVPSGSTFAWTSSPSGFIGNTQSVVISPTVNTTYFVTASNNGCIDSDSFSVSVLNAKVHAGSDTSICMTTNSTSLTLHGSATGNVLYNYYWTRKPSSPSISNPYIANPTVTILANRNDTFIVSMSTPNCVLYDTMIVHSSSNPTITKQKDTLICKFDTIQLYANSNQTNTTFSWTSLHNSLSCSNCYNPVSIIANSDTFTVVATNQYGCITSKNIKVITKPIPTASFTVTSPVCPNSNSTLTYTGSNGNGATFNWNFNTGIATPGGTLQGPQSVHWAVSDTYKVVLSVTKNNCTSLPDTQSIIVLPIPTSTFTANNAHCVGDTLVLTYSGNGASIAGADPLWTIPASATIVSGSIASFGPIKVIPAVGASIYSLKVNNGSCIGNVFKDTITISPNPTSNFTVSSPICLTSRSTITYTGTAANSSKFNWNFDGGTSKIKDTLVGPHSVQWSTTGTKNVSLWVNEKGCKSDTTTQQVQILQTPTAIFSLNNAHCDGDTLEIIYTGSGKSIAGSSATWNITPNPTFIVGNYTTLDTIRFIPAIGNTIINLVVSNGTCSDTLQDTITIFSIPENQFTLDSLVCLKSNTNAIYTGTAGNTATYNWNFDNATASPGGIVKGPHSLKWNTIGTKNVTLSVTKNGCTSAIDTQSIDVLQLPTSTFITNNAHCIGDTLMIVYTGNGKSISGSIAKWNINPAPTFIKGDTATLDTILFIPTIGNTIINLQVSNKICSATFKDTVTIFNYPTNTFTATSPVCPNQNSILNYTGNATTGATFNWNYDGGIVGTNTVKWSTSGLYNVSLSVSKNGCTSAIDTVQVSVLQIPTSTFTKSNAHCFGDTVTLIYTGDAKSISGSNLKWRISPVPNFIKGDSTTQDTIQFVPTIGNTIVKLMASNSNCSSVKSDTIRIYNYPSNSFTLTNDTACTPSTSTATYTGSASTNATYNWDFNSLSTTPGGSSKGPHTITIPNAGDYNISLFVTENGCSSETLIQAIKVYQSPSISILKNNPNCKGDTLTLNYSSASVTIPTWTIPASASLVSGNLTSTSPIKILLDTGLNHISISILDGICSSTAIDSIRIYKIPTSVFTINPATNCTSLASALTYTGNASNAAVYNWNFAGGTATPGGTTKNQSVVWNTANNYSVDLTVSENGCTSNLTSNSVNVLLSPTSTFAKNSPNCNGDTLLLNYTGNAASVIGATALWSLPSSATIISGSINSFGPIKAVLSTGMNHIGLTVTNSICTSTTLDSVRIYQIPTSTYSINTYLNCTSISSTITYTGNASGSATYNWNFAGGTASPGGTFQNQSVIWYAANNYKVRLTVTENGCTSNLTTDSIEILQTPNSTFSRNSPNCNGDTLVLSYTGTANSILGATAIWSIPASATIISGNLNSFGPIKAVLSTGMNRIGLTVTNSICISTTLDSVRIYQIPTSPITINPNPTCENQASSITYNGNASASAIYNWVFTNGVATPGGTAANQSVTWAAANNSNLVSLVVSENGCTSALTSQNVTVLQNPTASIIKNSPTCVGDTLVLNYSGNGQSISGATALWSFTNNPTIVSGSVNSFGTIKLIPKAGKTVVKMIVSNGICTAQAKDSVTITAIPTASFSFPNTSVCANSNLVFTYNGTAPTSATYNWNFNGGNATPGGTVKGPQTVNWSTAGTKTVTLQVVNNGCSSNLGSTTITVVAIPTTSFTVNPTQVCSGSTAVITYTGSNTATAYNWTASGTHTPSVLTGKGPHNVKWTNATSAIKTEMVILKVTQNGCTSFPDTNYVSIVPLPIASFTTNSPICPTDTLHVTFTGSNLLPTASYNWTFAGNSGSIGSGVGPYLINYANAGKYEITLSVTQNNCTSNLIKDSIKVLPEPIVYIYQDTTICEGSSVTLNATGANTYVWDNGLGTNPSITVSPTLTTTYRVVGSNGSCSAADDATINVSSYPIAYAGRDTMIPVNGNIELGTISTPGYNYNWTPSSTLNNAALSNPIAQPLDSTMYIVSVSNAAGCITLDSVVILVGRCYNPAIANTFTPNGDGENDNFRILNTHKLKSVEKFEIFNRWGEKIFSSNDIHNTTWDGTYHGAMQELGTYVYIIQATCLNDEKISLKGTVELIR